MIKKKILAYWCLIKKDYRHIICLAITSISVGFGFLFPNALPRLAETFRDLGTSAAYYFCEIFVSGNNPIKATVLKMPEWTWANDIWEPLRLFPWTWEEFKVLWGKYWEVFFSGQNFFAYWEAVGDFLYYFSRFVLLLVPIIVLVIVSLSNYKRTYCADRHKRSPQLYRFEQIQFKVIYPIIAWCKDFVLFCKENHVYCKIWVGFWMLHFNVISLIVAFLAFYLYFAVSFDFVGIYTQILKLLVDLAPMVRFIPGIIWFGIGVWVYNRTCRSMAFQRLYYAERCNRAFLRDRGVVTTIYGEMGIGKTQMVTSMALSAEIEQFDMAFEILLEQDMKFPNFPWQRFRDKLKKCI